MRDRSRRFGSEKGGRGFRPGPPLSRLRHAEKSVHNTGPALSSAKGKARVGGVNRIENSRPVSDSSSTVTHPQIESSPVKSRTNLRKGRFPPAGFYGKPVTISDIFHFPGARRIFYAAFQPIFFPAWKIYVLLALV